MKLLWTGKNGTFEIPVSALRLETALWSAGILEWETPCRELLPEEGDRVRLEEEVGIFEGYVFRVEDDGKRLRVLCYDQMKYLLCRDTRQFFHCTADGILRELAAERELHIGQAEAAGVNIPSLLCENQRLSTMVRRAAEETLRVSGREMILYDRCGALVFRQVGRGNCSILLSGENQITGWQRSSDIDGDVFTRFKILQEDRRSGFRRVLESENAEQRKKWGTLQYFEKVSHDWNEMQVRARMEMLKKTFGEKHRNILAEGIGDFRCLAGREVFCKLGNDTEQRCLIEESRLELRDGICRMQLKLREVRA